MNLTAEGVETTEQAEQLRQLGCDLGQGYLFARPLLAEELGLMIQRAFEEPPMQRVA
ncbi:MAG: EAL domain-containing protein [Chloroflexota bacterium]|nr:EAL domain-containing protein [Chloroflexota bacterium]